MKKSTISKTASALVTLLIASMLLPVLAFAASFGGFVKNQDGTVTGHVYLNQAEFDSITNAVYLNVFDSNGVWHNDAFSVSKSTYSYIDNQYVFEFDFDFTVNGATYNPVKFGFGGAVSDWVYKPETSTPVLPGPGGWFGGGTTVQNGQIDLGWSTDVSAADLLKAFEQSSNVIVKTQADYVTLPASALAEAAKTAGRTVTIVNNNGSYELPLSVLDFDSLSEELGADLQDVKIKIEIKKADETTTSNISNAIKAIGGKPISEATDYNVTAEANGISIEVNDFGQTFVKRTLPLSGSVNANMATAVAYDAATGQLQFVPSTFFTENDQSVATIYRNSNSVYTVISNDLTFDDVQGHWGQSYIELLANKLVVNGVGKGLFAPERDINRAEFAALLVRSLGLKLVKNDTTFSDVDSNAWYADVVATAAEAGLVNGYTDGTFRPLASITRQEIAAMVVRAIEFTGEDVKVSAAEADQLLAQYNDASGVTWAKNEMAAAIKSGIVQGTSNTTLRPTSNATRAQSATMLERYLKLVEFIN